MLEPFLNDLCLDLTRGCSMKVIQVVTPRYFSKCQPSVFAKLSSQAIAWNNGASVESILGDLALFASLHVVSSSSSVKYA